MEGSVINLGGAHSSLLAGWHLVVEREKGLYKALDSIAKFDLNKGHYFWDKPDEKSFGLFKPMPSGWLGQSLSSLFLTKNCENLEQIERVLNVASKRFTQGSIDLDLGQIRKELLEIEELDDKEFRNKERSLKKLIGRLQKYSSLFYGEQVSKGLDDLNRYYKGDSPSLARLEKIRSSVEPLERLFQAYQPTLFSFSIGLEEALKSREEKKAEFLSLFKKGSLPTSSDPELNELLKGFKPPSEKASFFELRTSYKKWESELLLHLQQKFSKGKLSDEEKEPRLKTLLEEFSRFPEIKKEIEIELQKIRGKQLYRSEKIKKKRLDQKIAKFSKAVDLLEEGGSNSKETGLQLKELLSRFKEMKDLKQFDYFEKYEEALFKLDGLSGLDQSLKKRVEEAKRLTVRGYLSTYFEGYEKKELILGKAFASIRKIQEETPQFLQSEEIFKRLPHGEKKEYTTLLFREDESKPLKSAYILFKQHRDDGIQPLGKGSFGKVSLAFDLRALKMRAVKTMSNRMGNLEQVHAMEFEGFSKTRGCRRVIQLLDLADYSVPLKGFVVGEPVEGAPPLPPNPETGKHSYFLKLYRHGTLEELLKKKQPLTLEEKKALTSDLLQGLAELKKRKGVLRDIKLENIFLNKERSEPVLADLGFFGEAERVGEGYEIKGTPLCIPPEQFLKPQEGFELEKHDIWSTGIVLHEIWFGARPSWAKGLDKIDQLKPLFEDPAFKSFEGREDEPISPLLEGMLEKDPEKRFDADQALACFEKHFSDKASKRAV